MYNNNNNQNQAQNQNQSTNKVEVPEARAALDNMKYEIAGELGINLKQLLPAAQYLTLMTAAPISFTRTRENMRSEHLEICYSINLTVAV